MREKVKIIIIFLIIINIVLGCLYLAYIKKRVPKIQEVKEVNELVEKEIGNHELRPEYYLGYGPTLHNITGQHNVILDYPSGIAKQKVKAHKYDTDWNHPGCKDSLNYEDTIVGNICIGKGAGKLLITEKLCIIVGHDSIHKNIKGSDMLWEVDWQESWLIRNNKIKIALLYYYVDFILAGRDTKENRSVLIRQVSKNYLILNI